MKVSFFSTEPLFQGGVYLGDPDWVSSKINGVKNQASECRCDRRHPIGCHMTLVLVRGQRALAAMSGTSV